MLKARSEASRQKLNFEIFWIEALLRAFSFASLSFFSEINVDNLLVTLVAGVNQ
jgi:hypothetical protein